MGDSLRCVLVENSLLEIRMAPSYTHSFVMKDGYISMAIKGNHGRVGEIRIRPVGDIGESEAEE